jgi:hypothetical protein
MTLTVVMTTYEDGKGFRSKYAIQAADSLFTHLKSSEPLKLHIADDGSINAEFIDHIRTMNNAWPEIGSTNAERRGIGASLNLALEQVESDKCWMYTTDDWILTHDFEIQRAMKLINAGYDLVRIGPVHPNLTCRTMFSTRIGWWLEILPQAGGFAFATRPFIATKKFYELVGPFDEGLNSYEVERLYCERAAKTNIRIAAMWLHGPWLHVGEYAVGHMDLPAVAK